MLDIRTTTLFDEERNQDGEVDVLEWGSKHSVVFSFTNPNDTYMIELHNITAAFRNS